MESKARLYVPAAFRVFQGFNFIELKEWKKERRLELHLERSPERIAHCWRCGDVLGSKHDEYRAKARHLTMMGWQVEVVFYREKHHCPNCKKVRSEQIEFLCPTSPHVTMELAWWLSRLSEETSVLAVSRLESVDKETCYKVDKFILQRLLDTGSQRSRTLRWMKCMRGVRGR
jgi:hypothetical protein